MTHKTLEDVEKELAPHEVIEDVTCPVCGGIIVTNYGPCISCTFCVDCSYNIYDYDF